MYVPAHHAPPSLEAMLALVDAHPLGTLVSMDSEGPVADHLPFVLDRQAPGQGRLLAHVARANPVWRHWHGGAPVLVVFQGPSHYVSPSWYPSKQVAGKVVPTWNYQAVHIRGVPRIVEDADTQHAMLEHLTRHAERPLHGDAHWRVADAPAGFIDKLRRATVAFQIEITSVQGRWKLAQDEAPADRAGAVDGLGALGTPAALAMQHSMVNPSRTL